MLCKDGAMIDKVELQVLYLYLHDLFASVPNREM